MFYVGSNNYNSHTYNKTDVFINYFYVGKTSKTQKNFLFRILIFYSIILSQIRRLKWSLISTFGCI